MPIQKLPRQRKQTVNPANLQEFLNSTPTSTKAALLLGQRQWFTPEPYAAAFPMLLHRADTIVDFQMGAGHLLAGSRAEYKIGADIDVDCARKPDNAAGEWACLAADTTLLAPILDEVSWRADTFGLNPPYSVPWDAKRLAFLAESRNNDVRETFAHATKGGQIDSSIATFLLALHFSTDRGEGFIVLNEATALRFFGDPNTEDWGMHTSCPARRHIWLWLSFERTIFPETGGDLRVAVLYFAANHSRHKPHCVKAAPLRDLPEQLRTLRMSRFSLRGGIEVKNPHENWDKTWPYWQSVKHEYGVRHGGRKPEFNIALSRDGIIQTYLTPFQTISGRIPVQMVKDLDALKGQSPLALVVQKASRDALRMAVNSDIWVVDPKLPPLVEQAIRDYNSVRAPFYPLSEIQRIGYLDESSNIVCRKHGLDGFLPGRSYALASKTVSIGGRTLKLNAVGEEDTIELSGHDLQITITNGGEIGHRFMHQTDLRLPDSLRRDRRRRDPLPDLTKPKAVDPLLHDLQTLIEHFEIPEVPDIATLRNEEYLGFLDQLRELEARANATTAKNRRNDGISPNDGMGFSYRNFQRDDIARLCLHDGGICSWQAGLGKTLGCLTYMLLKGGRLNLVVAPDSLHKQITEEAMKFFGIRVRMLMSQEAFLTDRDLQDACRPLDKGKRSQTSAELHAPKLSPEHRARLERFIEKPTLENFLGDSDGGCASIIIGTALGRCVRDLGEGVKDRIVAAEMHRSPGPITLWQAMSALDPSFPVCGDQLPKRFESDTITAALRYAGAWRDAVPVSDRCEHPLFYLTSYTALGMNGGDEWEPRTNDAGELVFNQQRLAARRATPGFEPVHELNIGMVKNGIKCVWAPTLSTLIQDLFDCVGVDEGVRIKSTDTYIGMGVRQMRPRFRLVLTATPIKNRLEDIFWLAWWVCGGTEKPNPRWPYEGSNEARELFANEHSLAERNLTKEAEAEADGKRRAYVKRTAQICNIHRLWKLLGPVVIRRRKEDIGEDIVAKKIIPIRVKAGTSQQRVYKHHLDNKPEYSKIGRKMNIGSQIAVQLGLLRQAALCPDSLNLAAYGGGEVATSRTDFTTKTAAVFSIIAERLPLGEQVIIMSPFQHASERIHRRLTDAGVNSCLLDGNMSPKKRGNVAAAFKVQRFAVMVAGIKAMGEGHSFACCNNLIRISLEWAFDINDQSGDRVHRLDSLKDVNIYDIITANTIEERLAALYHEKGDSANLALDGRLFADRVEEVNLAKLLRDAIRDFNPKADTIDERAIAAEWPELSKKLRLAQQAFNQWHPPIAELDLNGSRRGDNASLDEVAAAIRALAEPSAEAPRRSVSRRRRVAPLFQPDVSDALRELLEEMDALAMP